MSEQKTVYQLLRSKYPAVECVLMEEVSDVTGGRNRSADFIVVNLWPSRGNSIIGFEKKSNRGDWLNEMKNPLKQEAHFKFCDRYYLITDKEKVAFLGEIPETWGWMHSDGKKLKIIKEAPKLTPVECTRQFVCAMLRRAASKNGFIHSSEIENQIELRAEQILAKAKYENERKASSYDDLLKKIQEYEKYSGIDIRGTWNNTPQRIGEAVQKIMKWDKVDHEKKLINLEKSTQNILEYIQENLKDIQQITEQIEA